MMKPGEIIVNSTEIMINEGRENTKLKVKNTGIDLFKSVHIIIFLKRIPRCRLNVKKRMENI